MFDPVVRCFGVHVICGRPYLEEKSPKIQINFALQILYVMQNQNNENKVFVQSKKWPKTEKQATVFQL